MDEQMQVARSLAAKLLQSTQVNSYKVQISRKYSGKTNAFALQMTVVAAVSPYLVGCVM